MKHFIDLARAGDTAWCSSGELAARKLADAVLANVGRLDAGAFEAFLEFVSASRHNQRMLDAMLAGENIAPKEP